MIELISERSQWQRGTAMCYEDDECTSYTGAHWYTVDCTSVFECEFVTRKFPFVFGNSSERLSSFIWIAYAEIVRSWIYRRKTRKVNILFKLFMHPRLLEIPLWLNQIFCFSQKINARNCTLFSVNCCLIKSMHTLHTVHIPHCEATIRATRVQYPNTTQYFHTYI